MPERAQVEAAGQSHMVFHSNEEHFRTGSGEATPVRRAEPVWLCIDVAAEAESKCGVAKPTASEQASKMAQDSAERFQGEKTVCSQQAMVWTAE